MSVSFFLLPPFLFLFGANALADEVGAPGLRRSIEQLVGILDRADQHMIASRLAAFAEINYQRKTLSDWSIPELDALMDFWAEEEETHGRLHVWEEALIERYAFLDEKVPVQDLLAMNGELARLAREAGKGLEGNSAESLLGSYAGELEAIIKGWSRRDPKAAWTAVKGKGGLLFESPLIANYGYRLPRVIFEHLARADPEYARAEFLGYSQVAHDGAMTGGMSPGISNVLYQGSMLRGMARGLPDGYDWRALIAEALKTPRGNHWEIVHPLRGRILARWMQDDAEAAVAWFRGEEGKVISMEEVTHFSDAGEEIGPKIEPVSLRFAYRHWLANDWKGAVRWLRDRPDLIWDMLREGAWSDPDPITKADLRKLLVAVQPITVREDFLLKLARGNELRLVFSEASTWTGPPGEADWIELQGEIAELKVSDDVARRLFAAWQKQPADDDPFSN